MFLESCPGKFEAFYQYALPCDGSNVLRINPEKKTWEEIDPGEISGGECEWCDAI